MNKKILLSLVLILIVSISIGFVLQHIIGFWQGFAAAIITHFLVIVFNISKIKQEHHNDDDVAQAAFNNLLQTQVIKTTCPCGQVTSEIPVLINSDNVVLCTKCNSKFRINITFDTVLLTEPLNLENAFDVLKKKGTMIQ